jgi:hypothetical protein
MTKASVTYLVRWVDTDSCDASAVFQELADAGACAFRYRKRKAEIVCITETTTTEPVNLSLAYAAH